MTLRLKFWKKVEETNKAYVKYFYVKPDETPEQFEKRINDFFRSITNYSVEYDAFNEGTGLYFIRYIVTTTEEYNFRFRYILEWIQRKVSKTAEPKHDPK